MILAASAFLLIARIVTALEFSVALAWYEMIATGIGQAFLNAGSLGLVPGTLSGRKEMLLSGNSFVYMLGQLFSTITTQVCFMIFESSTQLDKFGFLFVVTPGAFHHHHPPSTTTTHHPPQPTTQEQLESLVKLFLKIKHRIIYNIRQATAINKIPR